MYQLASITPMEEADKGKYTEFLKLILHSHELFLYKTKC